ncbi:DUF2188 domain-containing protein [Acholeplasma manati]|uniref:DUF2188 domain-containing protein n=1 Tax=Paracholeplasma manati TaxID=591373 RepID=A0ABT2Y7Y9_9MOLU|nr:DUF2188 domain-containing protein [Paracholeplasma manati]MCV2232603.1 DUF2188 domain-containing protein [Paracholeplasma manati]
MQDFIIENGIYILIGLVLIFVVVTFLLSRKPEKQDKPVVPVNKESEPVEPEKVEEQPAVVENVVVEAPVTESVPEVIETPVKQVEEPIVEPTPEVKPTVVEEPKPEAVKPKAKPASEPKPKVAKSKSEPVKAPAAPASEPVDEDDDEEAALKRVVKNPKYHISMNKDDQSPYFKKWRVRKEGSTKTIKYFDTQKEAIAYATDLAEKANTSVVIHKVDGSIRKQDYSKK